MNLQQYKALFIVVTAVLALLVASPAFEHIIVYPQTEFFTELSLLGPDHMAENYPYNITPNESYSVFLGISNHLGSCAYYQVDVKFLNETQSAPDNFNRTSSTLPSLYNVAAFAAYKEDFELPVTVSFDYSFENVVRTIYTNVTGPGGASQNLTVEQRAENIVMPQAVFHSVTFNGVSLSLAGLSSDFDSTRGVFYGNLVFELWIYNSTINAFQYHERFVSLLLNMKK